MPYPAPLVTRNQSNNVVYIADDPNWDDQILIVNGNELSGKSYPLEPGQSANITSNLVEEAHGRDDMDDLEGGGILGVIFSDRPDIDADGGGFYQEAIGIDRKTGNMSMVDPADAQSGEPHFTLQVASQSPTVLHLDFETR
jgi:hypothetical protein